jgi:hypothetical protein
MPTSLLMALPIACSTSRSPSFTFNRLKLVVFPFVPSYHLQKYLFVYMKLLIGMSPYDEFPPSRIGYYHPMAANRMLQKLPSGKPHYSLS